MCKHHWVIEVPNGMFSIGRCKHCGDTKEFRNSLESDVTWSDYSVKAREGRMAS